MHYSAASEIFFFLELPFSMDDVNSGRDMARCKWVVPYQHPKHHAAHACQLHLKPWPMGSVRMCYNKESNC